MNSELAARMEELNLAVAASIDGKEAVLKSLRAVSSFSVNSSQAARL